MNPLDLKKYSGMSEYGKMLINEQNRQNAMQFNPQGNLIFKYTVTGIDLAGSQKQNADFTAMVSASVYKSGKETKIYILPNPINEKLTFPGIIEKAKNLSLTLGNGNPTKLYVEEAALQQYVVQQLVAQGFPAEGVRVNGDKWFRLSLLGVQIHNGSILFPKKGSEDLISQLVNFGAERHDDLADAFSLLANKITSINIRRGSLGFAFGDGAGNTVICDTENGIQLMTQDGKKHPYTPIHHFNN